MTLFCDIYSLRHPLLQSTIDNLERSNEVSFHSLCINALSIPNGAHSTSCLTSDDQAEMSSKSYTYAAISSSPINIFPLFSKSQTTILFSLQ